MTMQGYSSLKPWQVHTGYNDCRHEQQAIMSNPFVHNVGSDLLEYLVLPFLQRVKIQDICNQVVIDLELL